MTDTGMKNYGAALSEGRIESGVDLLAGAVPGLGVRLEGITKRFSSVVAIDDLSIDIKSGEFFSLLGPSGCGKSTLLRLIAGFERPDAGRVVIGDRDMTATPPQRRPTAMVFQNYALFPTMTVRENVEYGLRVRKITGANRDRMVANALERVDLVGFDRKPVTQLSGGQQQRVALARALAVEPEVLLFDEPLSNLDVSLRERTRRALKELHLRLGTTMIYVTHDQQEALALSDRIAVMQSGRIRQIGAPEDLYRSPETAFVAGFLGGSNIVRDPAVISALVSGPEIPEGRVLSVRPEHLVPDEEGPLSAVVQSKQFLGTYSEVWLSTGREHLRAWLDPKIKCEPGMKFRALHYLCVVDDLGDSDEVNQYIPH